MLQIDERIPAGREDVAGGDDIRAAEQHHAIAVGVGLRLMIDDHGFAVEAQILEGRRIFVLRKPGLRRRRFPRSGGLGHPVQHVRLGDDAHGLLAIEAPEIAHLRPFIALGQGVVSAHMVRVHVRVDDPINPRPR